MFVPPSTATGTILDNDFLFDVAGGTFSEAGNYEFVVTRTGDTSSPFLIDYATRAGTATSGLDFVAQTGTITFEIGEVEKRLSFPLVNDATFERAEIFYVDIREGGATGTLPSPIATPTATIQIVDDDAPIVNLEAISLLPVLEDGTDEAGRFAFKITLSNAPTFPVTVRLQTVLGTAGAGDLNEIDTLIGFAVGQTEFEGEVVIKSDRFAEAD